MPEANATSRLSRAVMRPGVRLMYALPMRSKLLVLALLLLVPLLTEIALSVRGQWRLHAAAQDRLRGGEVASQLLPLLVETQKHRSLTQRLLRGDADAAPLRQASREAIRTATGRVDAAIGQGADGYGHGELSEAWKRLQTLVMTVVDGPQPAGVQDAMAAHNQVVNAIRQFGMLSGTLSGLLLDPDRTSHQLAEGLVNTLPATMDTVAQARSQGSGLLVALRQGGSAEPLVGERLALLDLAGQMRRDLAELDVEFDLHARSGGQALEAWSPARDALVQLTRRIQADFADDPPRGNSGDFFDAASGTLAHLQGVANEMGVKLRRQQQQALDDVGRKMLVEGSASAVVVVVVAYLLLSLHVSFQASLRALRRGTEAMSRGDLAHRTAVRGNDELAEIGRSVDATCAQISSMVAEIRTSAALVNLAGSQVAEGSQRLSMRTDEQAGSLRGSVDAIGQLSSAVAQNAEDARQLDQLTETLFREAEQGHTAMSDTVQAMARMQEAAQRMAEVVEVIDDVAFQTGMLSLNAAVEAARAGDAGKGFAVVASEVRQLARRCAESADEIRALIGNAATQADASAGKLRHVAGALDTIVGGVREVSGRLRSISTASTQQSAGLGEVTENIGNLDTITRENAALVEMSATASSTLVDRAQKLREAVVSMRLRQASADEAHDLLQQAVAHIDAAGREQAFADFHARDGRFIDRDLYIFVMDRNGNISVFGANPALVGQPASMIPGLEAGSFLEKAWAAADGGGGWIQYDVVSPGTRQVTPKESFILPLGEGEFIGCGAYRRDGAAGMRQDGLRATQAA